MRFLYFCNMACNRIKFSAHGLIKLTVRNIDAEDVIDVLMNGETIFEYPSDKPYPSRLVLGWVKSSPEQALHVVVAEDAETDTCIVVTAYWPDKNMWERDYKTKNK